MALIVYLLHHSILINERRAIKGISKRAVGAEVMQFLTCVYYSHLEELRLSFFVNCINIEHACVALEIKLGACFSVRNSYTVGHRSSQVS